MKTYNPLDKEELTNLYLMLNANGRYYGQTPDEWDMSTLHRQIRILIRQHYGDGTRQANHSANRDLV